MSLAQLLPLVHATATTATTATGDTHLTAPHTNSCLCCPLHSPSCATATTTTVAAAGTAPPTPAPTTACLHSTMMHGCCCCCCCCAAHCYATTQAAAVVPVIIALPNYDYTAGLPGQNTNYYDTTSWSNSARGRYREDQCTTASVQRAMLLLWYVLGLQWPPAAAKATATVQAAPTACCFKSAADASR
eukprot:16757-Heterococcus_DN1.PRE.2